MFSRYQCRTTPKEKIAEKIMGATNASGELMFLMKWKGHKYLDLISAVEVNSTCPQIVIQFYEEKIILNTEADAYKESRKTSLPQKKIKIDKSDPTENNRNGTGIKNTKLEKNVSKTTPIKKKAEKIIGATKAGGELVYLMKWVGISDHDFIPAKEANSMFPQMVIKFYQERLTWDG